MLSTLCRPMKLSILVLGWKTRKIHDRKKSTKKNAKQEGKHMVWMGLKVSNGVLTNCCIVAVGGVFFFLFR